MTLEVLIENRAWESVPLRSLARNAIDATLAHLGVHASIEIAILGCDDNRIATLNATFRQNARATNVLSWPAQALKAGALPTADPDGKIELGNIAIAYETCAREANAAGKPIQAHVSHLLVHSCLHLFGYHHHDNHETALMERMEQDILGKMGFPDPYS